jgi:dihydroflavonol-4-reductase
VRFFTVYRGDKMSVHQISNEDLILVTGATGYIASHIVKQLLDLGYRVRATVRNLKDEKKTAPLRALDVSQRSLLELVEADLTNEACWSSVVRECTFVLHTASPVPFKMPNNEKKLIEPAVNGTLYVLRACVQDGCRVKRVVVTSSISAVNGDIYERGRTYTEQDWPDLASIKRMHPYAKSKMLAEKAAWAFVNERKSNGLPCFELATINPGFVLVRNSFLFVSFFNLIFIYFPDYILTPGSHYIRLGEHVS